MTEEYRYFEREQAVFRGRVQRGTVFGVDDVLTVEGWKPYTGDRTKPTMDGRQITAKEVSEHLAWLREPAT